MIKKTLLRREVRREIINMIVRGELQPGDRINESELSRIMGVSRTPLREALMRLENENIVISEPGKGFTIRPLSEKEISEVLPITANLESLAVASIKQPDSDLLEQLRSTNNKIRNGGNGAGLIELDAQWHELLVSQCENDTLKGILNDIRGRVSRYSAILQESAEQTEKNADHHDEIIDSVESGDLSKAAELVRSNWNDVLQATLGKMKAVSVN